MLVAHGVGTTQLATQAVNAATRQLISPGLRLAGFDHPALEAWVATLPED